MIKRLYSDIKGRLRFTLRLWLGVEGLQLKSQILSARVLRLEQRLADAQTVGADVHFRGNTQIVVVSRLHGGRVQFYDLDIKNDRELVERLAAVLGPMWPECVIDAPHGLARHFERNMESETGVVAPHKRPRGEWSL